VDEVQRLSTLDPDRIAEGAWQLNAQRDRSELVLDALSQQYQ